MVKSEQGTTLSTNRTAVRAATRYGLALGLVIVAAVVRKGLHPWVGPQAPFNTFYIAVALSAWFWGTGPAVFAAVLGLFVADYLFIRPEQFFHFDFGDPVYTVRTISYLAVAGAFIAITATLKRRQREAMAAQVQVRESEERHTLVSDTVPALISYVDTECKYRFCNRGYSDWFGIPANEIVGRPMRDVLGEKAWAIVEPHLRQALQGETADFEAELDYAHGVGARWIHAIYTPHRDPQDKVVGVVVMVSDIRSRKNAERAAQHSIEQLRLVGDAVPALLSYVDTENRYRFCNRAYSEWFGVPESEVIGKTMEEVLGERAWKGFQPYMARAFKGQRVDFEIEAHYQRGGPRWVRGIYTPHHDEQGKVIGIIVLVTDVSERKRWEEALRESEERYRTFIARSTEGVWRAELTPPIDLSLPVEEQVERAYRNGHVAECNDAMARMYGLSSAQDLIGRTLDFMLPAESPEAREYVASIVRAGYRVDEMESVERDAQGNAVYFTNSMAGIIEEGRLVRVWGTQRDITQRKLAEGRLIESEGRLRLFTEYAPAAIAMFDREMRYLAVSRRWKQDYGLEGDLIGRRHYEVFPELPERWKEVHRRGLAGEVLSADEDPIQRSSGRMQWIKWEVRPWVTGNNEIGGILVGAEDVTARVLAKQALLKSEEKFSVVFQKAPLPAALTKLKDGTFADVNEAFERLFGFAKEEVLGKNSVEVGMLQDAEIRTKMRADLHGQGSVHEREIKLRTKSGKECFVLVSADVVEFGGEKYAIGTSQDITERKRAEEALRESEERFRQLAENIPQLAWMIDANGDIIWYNKRWFEYTGTTAEEMRAGARQAVHHPEHVESVLAKFKQAMVSGQPWEDTFPLRSRDGAYRWFLSRAFPIRDAAGRISRWFGTNTDITELREAQENLKQARVDLEEHAARLEEAVAERTARLRETIGELEAFSYSLAHDMRAPLRAMQGFAKILGEEYGDQIGAGKEYLRRISASANRLDALILDVLNYSKIVRSDLPLQPIETKKFIREIIESYPNLHDPTASIRLEGPIPAVLANPAALTQVVSNLLGNAVKFVEPGVKPQVQVRAGRGGDHMIRVWFEDNGIGIPREVQARMFMMFQRLNPPEQYEGTGIGLTIVRKAMERMGGKVGVESEPGKGSRFWIELKEPG